MRYLRISAGDSALRNRENLCDFYYLGPVLMDMLIHTPGVVLNMRRLGISLRPVA